MPMTWNSCWRQVLKVLKAFAFAAVIWDTRETCPHLLVLATCSTHSAMFRVPHLLRSHAKGFAGCARLAKKETPDCIWIRFLLKTVLVRPFGNKPWASSSHGCGLLSFCLVSLLSHGTTGHSTKLTSGTIFTLVLESNGVQVPLSPSLTTSTSVEEWAWMTKWRHWILSTKHGAKWKGSLHMWRSLAGKPYLGQPQPVAHVDHGTKVQPLHISCNFSNGSVSSTRMNARQTRFSKPLFLAWPCSPPARWGLLDFMSVACSSPLLSSPLFSSPLLSSPLLSSPPLSSPLLSSPLLSSHPPPPPPAQPRSTLSVPCRTSTTTIPAQCSLPDLNREYPRPVFPAGPQPRPSTPSVPCRTSTASIHAKCSLPDLM